MKEYSERHFKSRLSLALDAGEAGGKGDGPNVLTLTPQQRVDVTHEPVVPLGGGRLSLSLPDPAPAPLAASRLELTSDQRVAEDGQSATVRPQSGDDAEEVKDAGQPTEATDESAKPVEREAEMTPEAVAATLNPLPPEDPAPIAASDRPQTTASDTAAPTAGPEADTVASQDRSATPEAATPAQAAESVEAAPEAQPAQQTSRAEATRPEPQAEAPRSEQQPRAEAPQPAQGRMPEDGRLPGETIEGDTGPILKKDNPMLRAARGGGGDGSPPKFHKRLAPNDFGAALKRGKAAVRSNMVFILVLTCATNLLILAIPIYLFQISDRVLTSRSVDTLIMLTIVIGGAVVLQAIFDAIRRFMLMRTAVEVAAQLGAPILSAAAAASLHSNGREYQTLGDLQQVRGFLVSGTLISFLDVPFAPIFIAAIFLVHPHLGTIVCATALLLLVIALINQKITSQPFAEANQAQSKANLHLDSMSRNSQIINALAMIPEAVRIWGRDTAASLTAQVRAQDRNIVTSAISRMVRLLTQIAMLGWGAYLAIDGQITGGMVIAASIIAGRALAPIEGAIEGWNAFTLSRAAYGRITDLLKGSKLQFEKLNLPQPEGRLDVERLLYVPAGTKQVVLNGISFSLNPGESLGVIGNSGAGKTTLGKMLVGSILPTSGNVRLDLMDLRNWDPRQFGENIGYLPQDVQLFPGTIKDNIGRMRADATDAAIYEAAKLADVHELIANLPQGYETVVAADGSPLSGGQKQRIALARAFFGNPTFVVLDEPNSNLDTAGDKALARAIQHARASGITTVVVTQKPKLLASVDKVMLLVDGRIKTFGERQAVLMQIAGQGKPPQGQNRVTNDG